MVPDAPPPQSIRESAAVLSALDLSGGSDFHVVLIREGLAKSGRYFTREAVRQIASAADGLRAFADHPTPTQDRERPVRSVADMVGYYDGAAVAEVEGRLQAEATLHLFDSAAWLAGMVREALQSGHPDIVGLSIDAVCVVRPGSPPELGRSVPVVEQVLELRSTDVVTRPSAGGRFLTVKEADVSETGTALSDVTLGIGEQQVTATREQELEESTVPEQPPAIASARRRRLTEGEEPAIGQETQRLLTEVREAQRAFRCEQILAERLGSAHLPEPVAARVRQQWAYASGRWSSPLEYSRALEAAIEMEVETVGRLRDLFLGAAGAGNSIGHQAGLHASSQGASGTPLLVSGMGSARVDISAGERQRLAVQLGLDRLMGVKESEEDPDYRRAREIGLLPSVPRWTRLREAYTQITGDWEVAGAVHPDASIVREANEVTSGVLNFALLNSMTKRLVQDYAGQPQEWRKFCSVRALKDFKNQDRIRLHDFATLSTVAEGAAYTNLAWDDARENYAPSKRGNLVVVTREAILNDDLFAIQRIPPKLAVAAGITINEFIYGLITTNPFMNDGSKVFDDGVQNTHNNRSTAALSSTALQAAITSMMKQTNSASKRLNLRPRYLLVPPDLLFTALTLVNSTLVPGSTNNDANVLKGAVEPISVAQFADPTDWYLVCDPAQVESIEVGFVNGRESPEFLLQDRPLAGQVFTNDQISFKVRWEFGGAWLDYRGAHWAQVA
jgi:hypothetical protein